MALALVASTQGARRDVLRQRKPWPQALRRLRATPASALETAVSTPAEAAPIDEFSNCHGGILNKLDALDGLPALLAPAALARRIATDSLEFFDHVVYAHHREEEQDLFPAVRDSAVPGAEREQVLAMVDQLTREHRQIEAAWERLKPQLRNVAKGADTTLDGEALGALVQHYREHARFEEQQFLPLSKRVLGRNGDHMAALGVALHIGRAMPGVLGRYGHRI